LRSVRSAGRATIAAVATVALGVGLMACGSDESDSSAAAGGKSSGASGSATAALVEEHLAPVSKWPGPNEPVDPPAGKQITIIICGSQGSTCVRAGDGAKAAAAELGYKASVVDGRNDPAMWNSLIQDAIARRTDGIILAAVPPKVVAGPIAEAKKAGIPVIALVTSESGDIPTSEIDVDRELEGHINAAMIAEDSGGDAKVIVIREPTFDWTNTTADVLERDLEEQCDACEIVDRREFSISLASQRLASTVTSSLQRNPDAEYMVVPMDTVVPFVQQGIRQAGKSGRVKILSYGAERSGLAAIEAGDELATVGHAAEWMGWQGVDQLVRLFDGTDPAKLPNPKSPIRLITAENLDTLQDTSVGWKGDYDFEAKFKELWRK
jgi:ribose transport system substrate-binding protein